MTKKISSTKPCGRSSKKYNGAFLKCFSIYRGYACAKIMYTVADQLLPHLLLEIFDTLKQNKSESISLNVFIAYIKQGVGPQVFPTLVTALPLQSTYITLNGDIYSIFKNI